MEKPDKSTIEQIYTDWINSRFYYAPGGCEWPEEKEIFEAGCEHVWNTHVVPLQKELAHEVNQREEYFEDAQILLDDKKKLESEIKALREENTKCKELSWEAANEILRLKKEIDRLKAEVLKEKFPEN